MLQIKFAIVLSLFYAGICVGQDLNNLEYCHESINMRNIYFLESDIKVAISPDLKSIYLLKGGNVIRDTLSVKGDLIQSVSSLGRSEIALNFMNYSLVANIASKQMRLIDTIDYRKLQFYPSSIYTLDLMSRFRPVKDKRRKHINYVQELRTEDGTIKQITDNYPKIVRRSYSNQLIGKVFFDRNEPLIYLSLEGAGKFCLYDYVTSERKVFTLQDRETKKQSWFVFYDAKTDQLHPVKFRNDGKNEVYSFDPKTQQLTPLMTIDFRPLSIIGGRIHKRDMQKDDKGKLLCHYLVPLSSEKQEETVILEAVEVSSN